MVALVDQGNRELVSVAADPSHFMLRQSLPNRVQGGIDKVAIFISNKFYLVFVDPFLIRVKRPTDKLVAFPRKGVFTDGSFCISFNELRIHRTRSAVGVKGEQQTLDPHALLFAPGVGIPRDCVRGFRK